MSEEENQPDAQAEMEVKARKQGWKPAEEFDGDADKCVSAEVFLERGKDINSILRKNNEALEGSVEKLRTQIEKNEKSNAEFRKYHADTATRVYNQAVKDIEAKKAEAVENEDVVAYQNAETEEKQLVKPVATPEPTMDQPHPEFVAWAANNPWYNSNAEAHAFADTLGPIVNQQTGLEGAALFDAVKERVARAYPDISPQPRSAAPAVETGGKVPPSGKKTYADLPADAKTACDGFVSDGFLTKEQYVKDFDWSAA